MRDIHSNKLRANQDDDGYGADCPSVTAQALHRKGVERNLFAPPSRKSGHWASLIFQGLFACLGCRLPEGYRGRLISNSVRLSRAARNFPPNRPIETAEAPFRAHLSVPTRNPARSSWILLTAS